MSAQERHTMVVKNFESPPRYGRDGNRQLWDFWPTSASEPLDGSERSGAYREVKAQGLGFILVRNTFFLHPLEFWRPHVWYA